MTARLLITGGGGFIGTNLIHELRCSQSRYELSVLDNESAGTLAPLAALGVETIRADIRDFDAVARLKPGVSPE